MSFEKKIKAYIVKQNDEVIYEYYQNSKAKTKLHKVNSCTKSFTGLLLGIALDLGYRGQFSILIPELSINAAIVSDVEDSMKPFWVLINLIDSLIEDKNAIAKQF